MSRWTAGSLIGPALGFGGGGVAGLSAHSWRFAFFIAGVPGLLFTYLAYRLKEPRRGQADEWGSVPQTRETPRPGKSSSIPFAHVFKKLLGIRTIVVTILVQIFCWSSSPVSS